MTYDYDNHLERQMENFFNPKDPEDDNSDILGDIAYDTMRDAQAEYNEQQMDDFLWH